MNNGALGYTKYLAVSTQRPSPFIPLLFPESFSVFVKNPALLSPIVKFIPIISSSKDPISIPPPCQACRCCRFHPSIYLPPPSRSTHCRR